jgi:uncharacterized protein YaiE (UPF0345 family)
MKAAIATLATLVACVALAAPARALADSGDRVKVCAASLDVTTEPNQDWMGSLDRGETFLVRNHSDSGKYAYGFAYGHINRDGWVETSGLCGDDAHAASPDIVGRRIAVCMGSLDVTTEPNQGWMGSLDRGETFDVRKLSDSGKYAYGLAYGHINRVGWVLTSGLCGSSQASAPGASDTALAGERVPVIVDRLSVTETPNGTQVGTLGRGETFRVSKLSASAKYAYGVAYGDANTPGWVMTEGLHGGTVAEAAAS